MSPDEWGEAPEKVSLQVAVIDDRDYQQRESHLASAKYHGIHSAYGKSTDNKFETVSNLRRCR
jgi:hypothetical protein